MLVRLRSFSLLLIVLLLLPSGFAFFSFLSFPPPPPPIFRLSDVNGEDLNVEDVWARDVFARNIDANSITINYVVARNELDFNILHDANFFGMVESLEGFVSDLFCSFSDRENCLDLSGGVWQLNNAGLFVDGDLTGFDITANNDLDVLNDLDVADDVDIHGTLTVDESITATGGLVVVGDSNFGSVEVGESLFVFGSTWMNDPLFVGNICDKFGLDACFDLRGDPFALTGIDFQFQQDLGVLGDSNFVDVGISGKTFALDFVNLHADPVLPLHAATKEYVDIAVTGIEFDFFLTDSVSGIGGDYFDLVDGETGEPISINTSVALGAGLDQEIFNYATVAGQPEFDTLLSSVYNGHFHFLKTGGASKTVFIYWSLYQRDILGTETLMIASENSAEITTSQQSFDIHGVLAEDTEIDGNRIVLKIFANVIGGGGTTQVVLAQEGVLNSRISLRPPNTALDQLYLLRSGNNFMNADLNLGGNTLYNGNVNATGDSNFTNIGVSGNSFLNALFASTITATGTITSGNITIFDTTPILIFKDSDGVGGVSTGFIEWRGSDNNRLGFFGNSTIHNDDLLWKNESSGGHIQIQTSGGGELRIFANTVLNDNSITGINNLQATGDSNFVNLGISGNTFLNALFASSLKMSGSIDMGTNDITNATNITAIGDVAGATLTRNGTEINAGYLAIDGSNANTPINIGVQNFTTAGILKMGNTSGLETTGQAIFKIDKTDAGGLIQAIVHGNASTNYVFDNSRDWRLVSQSGVEMRANNMTGAGHEIFLSVDPSANLFDFKANNLITLGIMTADDFVETSVVLDKQGTTALSHFTTTSEERTLENGKYDHDNADEGLIQVLIPEKEIKIEDENGKITTEIIPEHYGKSLGLLIELQRDAIFELKTENELQREEIDLMKESLCKLGEIQWCN